MGFLGTFDMMFLISLANYPKKFSLVLFYFFQVKTYLSWAKYSRLRALAASWGRGFVMMLFVIEKNPTICFIVSPG